MLLRVVEHCKNYQGSDIRRSIAQAALNLGLYIVAMTVIIKLIIAGSWPIALMISPLAGGLLVKLFTIQHDCGHGSYFTSKKANNALGFVISILTMTPYGFWRDSHNRHHASSGDLDRRGIGAVDTLTVTEFRALSPAKRFAYECYRHPVVMIFLGSPIYFLILQRLPLAGKIPYCEVYHGLRVSQIWKSVMALNIALVLFYGSLSFWLGPVVVALAFVPPLALAAWIGTWLFFVQHQYEDAYWSRKPKWNFAEAALYGSSYYKLPTMLRWFTGNIGLHHIHHLASRIPNYRLMECYRKSKDLQALPVMTIPESLKCARLALWCEVQQRMVSFKAAR